MTCLREAAFSLRAHFGEEGSAKAGNAAGLSTRATQNMRKRKSALNTGLNAA